ncbi:hypothetical protein GWK47_031081 [Chionoecetes opilio]|uniref:Uncharacterized protein n=1 Tax=Chionoecetes opilio TaxID=41210 RepID=A0A8J4YVA9_CHIOP|nr:hypothetical protein GWK47_031081 [Chionoecetes opilio]
MADQGKKPIVCLSAGGNDVECVKSEELLRRFKEAVGYAASSNKTNSEMKCSLINRALASYEQQYHDHINSLRHCQITEFLRIRFQAQQPENGLQAGPSMASNEPFVIDEPFDFDGFTSEQLKTSWMSYRLVVVVIYDNTPHKLWNIPIHLSPSSSPK